MAYNSYSRSGRSSSQSTIFDYPEHLNPFYEDENHKRLRFWKFGSGRSEKDKSERRSSFSLGGFKDLWEFKTFRPKKKRDSSLGISKTSESPPPLRHSDFNGNYNTIGASSVHRNTVQMGMNDNFERNATYRSSLQVQSRENGLAFNRNNRYRSTIQNGYATYGGSVTPTPRTKYSINTMTPSSSQISLRSTNPFDDDDDCSIISTNDDGCRQNMKRPARKKRRAPPPPVLVTRLIENGEDDAMKITLKIEEPNDEKQEEAKDLHNLTAEIESFVRISTTTDECDRNSQLNNNLELKIEEEEPKTPEKKQPEKETLKIEDQSVQNTPISKEVEFILESLALPETPVPARRKTKKVPESRVETTKEVTTTITTTTQASSDPVPDNVDENIDSKIVKTENYEFKVKLVPLKDEPIVLQPAPKPESEIVKQNGTVDRRRSVKDIIESINKSQSLLKINQDISPSHSKAESMDSITRNFRELSESEREIKRLIEEMDYTPKSSLSAKHRSSVYDNVPGNDENLDNFDVSNNLFEKCVLRSKKSPTKSLGIPSDVDENTFQDCIEWNPIPKPRRSMNFSVESNGNNDPNNNIDPKT